MTTVREFIPIFRPSRYVDGLPSLAEYGVNELMAKDTFKWLGGLPRILLPEHVSKACMDAVVAQLTVLQKGKHKLSAVDGIVISQSTESQGTLVELQVSSIPDSSIACHVAALVDHSNQEAVCTALLIRELLKAHFPLLDLVPHVLGHQDHLTKVTKVLLVICSNGCFQQRNFVRQLFEAASVGVGIITVVVEQSFRFPTEAFYSKVREAYHVVTDSLDTTEDFVLIIRKIFEEIAVGVHPQDSEEAVKVRVAATMMSQPVGTATLKSVSSSKNMMCPCDMSSTSVREETTKCLFGC